MVLVASTSYISHADPINLDNIREIKPVELMPEAEFEEKTKIIDFKSEDDENLAFSVRLPSDWEEVSSVSEISSENINLGQKVLGVIARYSSPPSATEKRSIFSVEAMELTYEIGARNWFINYVLLNGLSLEGLTEVNKRELEAIYVVVEKDTSYIVRARAFINGSRMVVARYYVPQEKHADEKVMQAQIIKSFKLKNLNESTIEKLKTHAFLTQSYFDYPPSWEIYAPKILSIENMRATLYNNVLKKHLDGQIDIKLYNKLSVPNRSDVIKNFRQDFSIQKYEVGDFIESPEMEYHSDISYGTTQAYELNPTADNMIKYELWVSVLEGKDYYYLVYLMTPSREEEFYKWARNIESYKLIVKSIRRKNPKTKINQFMQ